MEPFHHAVGWAPNPAHAIVAGRLGRRAVMAGIFHPGWGAGVMWLVWRFLTSPAIVAGAQGADIASGARVARVSGTLHIVAAGIELAGTCLAVYGALLFLFSIFTTPTHVAQGGRWRAIPPGITRRPTVATRASRPGAYRRVKAGYRGVLGDWHDSQDDYERIKRHLAKVGAWRWRRRHRRWAIEDARGVERSQPGRIDRWLMRRTDPPKQSKRKAKRQARRAEKRAERKAGPAPYPVDAGPRLDPTDGPPLSPQQAEAHADRLEDQAQQVRAEANGTRQRLLYTSAGSER